ncbi:SapC family protein [Pseudodonghicola flavimaris]|uniref:SapC family protein n=1 Tax=Pseudodonghicola flavimaris TaxID=3050036 RepID=A0ABT7F0D8_9RHOB|nr:SapC family protein [Pseudodonghicola flavimaris]MDK3018045.1 SapC family protein [Pseudodonghicola flavimaris]
MPVQQLFYKTAVPVSADRHGDLSVSAGKSYAFAKTANSIPVTAAEFAPAAAHHPIVFAGSGDEVVPAVILGTRDDENLAVDAEGQWRETYIPAFVRRYPFIFALDNEKNRFTLLVDEEFDGANREGRGERLFDSEGEQTGYLKSVLKFLQDYQASFARTQAFCKRMKELDLLVPMQAEFSLAAGQKRTLGGFQVVDRERLKALSGETLADLCRKDELECIYLHLSSMRHFRDMLGRANSEAASAVEPTPAAAPEDAAEPMANA